MTYNEIVSYIRETERLARHYLDTHGFDAYNVLEKMYKEGLYTELQYEAIKSEMGRMNR